MPRLFARSEGSFWIPAVPFVERALQSFLTCPRREDNEYVYTSVEEDGEIFETEFKYDSNNRWMCRIDGDLEYMLQYM